MTVHFMTSKQRWRVQLRYRRKRINRLLPPGITEPQARAIHERMRADLFVAMHSTNETGWEEEVERAFANSQSWFHKALARARNRSRGKAYQFALTAELFKAICLRSGGRCEVTGMRFSDGLMPRSKTRPFFQSLDRIDASLGYGLDNCRLVCTSVNLALSAFGDEVFHRMAIGYVVNQYCGPGLVGALIASHDSSYQSGAKKAA